MTSFSYPDVDVRNATAVAIWYETHAIPQRYNAAIVVASILVATLGAYSTLIVLGKRTSNTGVRSFLLLVWAAMTMSCVGIWGMHFIGMNFRLEPLPGQSWYVSFSPAFTVFSLIVPFVALVLAFVFVDYFTLQIWRIAVSGTLTGCIVGLMHYSASMRSNFQVSYEPTQTVISILLACVCANVALTLFFRLRAQWQDSWQRRLMCSFILATGVSGMHYIGAWGTSYKMRPENVDRLDRLANGRHSNTTVVIIVSVMAFVIAVASAYLSISDLLTTRETRKKARKIVLASASFDHLGRLLVQADGSLPLVVLEEANLRHVEVLDALDARSDTFQWLFSVSWAWNIVVPFLDAIATRVGQRNVPRPSNVKHAECKEGATCPHTWRARFARTLGMDEWSRRDREEKQRASAEAAAGATSYNARGAVSRSLALLDFRDRVVDAARRLSDVLEVPLNEVGVFYDHALPTGTHAKTDGSSRRRRPTLSRSPKRFFVLRSGDKSGGAADVGRSPYENDDDEEASISTGRAASIFGDGDEDEEGVSMFLVREMAATEQTAFAKRGYRFTETRFLANVLADRHGVSKMKMDELLDGMRLYAKRGTKPVVQPGGVYAGLFGVRPSISARQGGLDVLVYNFARHQIPAFRLPDVVHVTEQMRAFLRLLHQMPVDQALRVCERESIRSAERNKAMARVLLDQTHAQRVNVGGGDRDNASPSSVSAAKLAHGVYATSDLPINVNVDGNGFIGEDSVRQMLAMQAEESSLQAFQVALYTALEALMQSVRVFPRLNATARVSADILEVPSSLDDATPPALVILVQAVLPAEKSTPIRSSASTLGGLMGHQTNGGGGGGMTEQVASSLVMPTEMPRAGTPFVFTPYTLFNKTQTMLLRGKMAQTFSSEAQLALSLRYNVHPGDYTTSTSCDEGEKGKRYSRSEMSHVISCPDDVTSMHTGADKSVFEKEDEEDVQFDQKSELTYVRSAKRWITNLSTLGKHDHSTSPSSSPDDVDQHATPARSAVPPRRDSLASPTSSSTNPTLSRSPNDASITSMPSVLPSTYGIVGAVSPSHSQGTGSLGIRRFTQSDSTSPRHKTSNVDQNRFARPASSDDDDEQSTAAERDPPAAAAAVVVKPSRRRSSRANAAASTVEGRNGDEPSTVMYAQGVPMNLRPRSRTVVTAAESGFASFSVDSSFRRPSTSSTHYASAAVAGSLADGVKDDVFAASPFATSAVGMPRRPHTVQGSTRRRSSSALPSIGVAGGGGGGIVDHAIADGTARLTHQLDADSVQARQRLDNWQLRQLRDLERFQPNLLLGVLPSEY